MKQTIHAVIFDCDGTLVDSEVPGMDVLHQLACQEGLACTREEAHAQFRGVRMADVVAWIAARLPHVPDTFAQDFTQRVREATTLRFQQGITPLPGASALLGALRVPFCVATNGPREKVELTLGLTGLRPFFGEHIFCAYETGSFKPDPGLFLHAARVLGVAPGHCAVVEDSLTGIRAGLAAGMQVFTLHERTGLPAELMERVTCIRGLSDLHGLWPDLLTA